MEHLSGKYYSATMCQNRAAKSKRGRVGKDRTIIFSEETSENNEFSGVTEILWN